MQEELCFFAAADNWPLNRPIGGRAPLAEIAGLELVLPSGSGTRRNPLKRLICGITPAGMRPLIH